MNQPEPALCGHNLSYAFGDAMVLNRASFSVPHGCFCALLGLNGAGKSTLFSLMTGLYSPMEGAVSIMGHDMARESRKALKHIGIVFQENSLDLDLNVRDNMLYFAAIHGLSGPDIDARIIEVSERMGVADKMSVRVSHLNAGHRRRAEIARSLIHRPSILLLDEPTVGLDPPSRRSVTEHVHALCRDEGVTAFWATQLSDEVQKTDHLIILHEGHIIAQGKVADITAGRSLDQAFMELVGKATDENSGELQTSESPQVAASKDH